MASENDFYAVYDKYQRGEYITSEDINTLYEVGEPAWAEYIGYEQKLKLDPWDPNGPTWNIQMSPGHVGDWGKSGDNPIDVPQHNIPSYIKRRSEAKNQNLGTLEEEIDFLKDKSNIGIFESMVGQGFFKDPSLPLMTGHGPSQTARLDWLSKDPKVSQQGYNMRSDTRQLDYVNPKDFKYNRDEAIDALGSPANNELYRRFQEGELEFKKEELPFGAQTIGEVGDIFLDKGKTEGIIVHYNKVQDEQNPTWIGSNYITLSANKL